MVFTQLKLKNFRGVKEGELKLAPLTILLGPNNSGKSTILEALFLIPNPFRSVPYVPDARDRYQRSAVNVLHSIHKTLDSVGYTFLMHNYVGELAEIEWGSNEENFSLSIIKEEPWLSVYTNRETKQSLGKSQGRSLIGRLHPFANTMTIGTHELLAPNTLLLSADSMKMGYEYFRDFWPSIINRGISSRAIQTISDLVREKYEDMTLEPFLGGHLSLYAYLKDRRRIRLGDLGEGFQIYSSARMLFEIEKPKVLLWNDVEAHINPKMLFSIANWFSELIEQGNQVILTTHSLEATRTIAAVNEESSRICLLDLRNNVLKSEEFSPEKLEEYSKAGIDLRTAEALL